VALLLSRSASPQHARTRSIPTLLTVSPMHVACRRSAPAAAGEPQHQGPNDPSPHAILLLRAFAGPIAEPGAFAVRRANLFPPPRGPQ
jgi:hypothetical protein